MTETKAPAIPDGLWTEDLEEEIVILVEADDQIHILNETAAEIWRLVDGQRSLDQIQRAFADTYPDVDPQILAEDVREVLDDLGKKGLVLL